MFTKCQMNYQLKEKVILTTYHVYSVQIISHRGYRWNPQSILIDSSDPFGFDTLFDIVISYIAIETDHKIIISRVKTIQL